AAVFGGVCAWAISTVKSKIIDSLTAVISSVLANDGGVPLAFSFIVAVGNTGYFTALVTAVDSTFTLYSVKGLILMYQYFLIPTMILLTLPSFVALRQQWREAHRRLGRPSLTLRRRARPPARPLPDLLAAGRPACEHPRPARRMAADVRFGLRHPRLGGRAHRHRRLPPHSARDRRSAGRIGRDRRRGCGHGPGRDDRRGRRH